MMSCTTDAKDKPIATLCRTIFDERYKEGRSAYKSKIEHYLDQIKSFSQLDEMRLLVLQDQLIQVIEAFGDREFLQKYKRMI